MGVALPELPDDRRAQPRRHAAADADPAPRHGRDVPAGRHAAASPDGLPGRPWAVDEDYGRRGLPGEPEPLDRGYAFPPGNGHRAGAANGNHGRDEPGRSGSGPYPPAPQRGRAPGGPAGNGHADVRNGRPGQRDPGQHDPGHREPGGPGRRAARYPDEPDGGPGYPPRNGHAGRRGVEGGPARPPAGPADDDTVALPVVPPAPEAPESDVPPPRRPGGAASRAAFQQKPVQRPAADEDPPTVLLRGDQPGDDAFPGRHRRRAGESADGRPAVDYRAEAAAAGHPTRGGRRRRPAFWKELPILVVVALLLTFLIQTFVAKVYVIPSGSMETTLHGCTGCSNDRVLVDKVSYRFADPRPGDVVVFRGPDGWTSEFTADPPSNVVVAALQQLGSLVGLAPPDEKDFIKRVIAVGGQTVQCCDSRNRVLVDGKALDEPYIYYLPEAGPARQDSFGPVKVPQGSLWMMGDSRNNSADSRVAGHGPVPVSDVIGKARVIVLPFARFGSIPDPNPQATPVGMGGAGGAADTPVALGLAGVLPLIALRRRRGRDEFLPGD